MSSMRGTQNHLSMLSIVFLEDRTIDSHGQLTTARNLHECIALRKIWS